LSERFELGRNTWPKRASGTGKLGQIEATKSLQKAASLFSNLSTRLEYVMSDVLGKTQLDSTEVEKETAKAIGAL
jgi:hypothetical protein